jgi:plastocyanin
VKIGDYFFSPHALKVHKGTKVTWKWTGAIVHDVAVVKGPVKFRPHKQLTGTYSHIFARNGTYSLRCTIHPTMKETITVS